MSPSEYRVKDCNGVGTYGCRSRPKSSDDRLWWGGLCKAVCMQKPAKTYPVGDCGGVDTLMGCACVAAEVGERVHGDGL